MEPCAAVRAAGGEIPVDDVRIRGIYIFVIRRVEQPVRAAQTDVVVIGHHGVPAQGQGERVGPAVPGDAGAQIKGDGMVRVHRCGILRRDYVHRRGCVAVDGHIVHGVLRQIRRRDGENQIR